MRTLIYRKCLKRPEGQTALLAAVEVSVVKRKTEDLKTAANKNGMTPFYQELTELYDPQKRGTAQITVLNRNEIFQLDEGPDRFGKLLNAIEMMKKIRYLVHSSGDRDVKVVRSSREAWLT